MVDTQWLAIKQKCPSNDGRTALAATTVVYHPDYPSHIIDGHPVSKVSDTITTIDMKTLVCALLF